MFFDLSSSSSQLQACEISDSDPLHSLGSIVFVLFVFVRFLIGKIILTYQMIFETVGSLLV